MAQGSATDVHSFLDDLDGGVLAQKIGAILSEVALGVVTHHKNGKVNLQFDLKQIGQSNQVAISHSLNFSRPTRRGKISEEETLETPMHVNTGGKLTLFPENQGQLFTKNGEAHTRENS
jgi:hypothetical protein